MSALTIRAISKAVSSETVLLTTSHARSGPTHWMSHSGVTDLELIVWISLFSETLDLDGNFWRPKFLATWRNFKS